MTRTDASVVVMAAIPPELRAALASAFELIEAGSDKAPIAGPRVAVTTSVAGADGGFMDRLPDLGLILCNGTGLENVDLDECARRGIVVRNTPDEVTQDTAEFAIAMIFAASRRLAEADRFVRSGRWGGERMTPSRRVGGRSVGIVGLGKIGRTIAARCAGLGISVLYTGPRAKPDVPHEFVPTLMELAERVDTLVLSCPGGPATEGLVDAGVLAALGPEGLLVNVARGSVVEEEALLQALENGTVAGAGLDVFAAEPGIDRRFLSLDNVVLTPHYAAVTRETRQAMAATLVDAAHRFLKGLEVRDAASGRGAGGLGGA